MLPEHVTGPNATYSYEHAKSAQARAGGEFTAYPWAKMDAPIRSADGRRLTLPRP